MTAMAVERKLNQLPIPRSGGKLADLTVHVTRDYTQFKPLNGNRGINKAHVESLKRSMSERHLISPLIVNERMYVIDGQHRLAAASALGLPVYYVICKGYGVTEMQTLNQNSTNWGVAEFVACYASLGNENYQKLIDFKTKFKFGWHETLTLLGVARPGRISDSSIVKGTAIVSDEVVNWAESVATRILECGQYYEGFRRRSFIFAMMRMLQHPAFVFNEWIDKLRLCRSKMYDCVDTESYIELIEEIYNYRRQGKVNLRF